MLLAPLILEGVIVGIILGNKLPDKPSSSDKSPPTSTPGTIVTTVPTIQSSVKTSSPRSDLFYNLASTIQSLAHPNPNGMSDNSDKQLVVFGDSAHPGVNTAVVQPSGHYTNWETQLSQSDVINNLKTPIVRRACQSAIRAVFPKFTPKIISKTAEDICFESIRYLTNKGLELTEKNVVQAIKDKYNQMVNRKNKPSKAMVTASAKRVVKNMQSKPHPNGTYIAGVSAPAAMGRVVGKVGSARTRSIKNGVVITHSEMISTLVSSGTTLTYQATGFVINPGKGDVFPWLSSIAVNYDKYRLRKLVVYVNSMQPTNNAGKMGIAFDPDSTDDLPADRGEVYAMYKHVEGPLWQSLAMEIPVSNQIKFCNTHTDADSKLIDEGQIILFSDLVVALNSALADVIVEYEVELLEPQQALFATSQASFNNYAFSTAGFVVPSKTTGPRFTSYYLNSATVMYLAPSPGYYTLVIRLNDAGSSTPTVTITNGTSSGMSYLNIGSATNYLGQYFFRITSNSVNYKTGTIVGDKLTITLGGAANFAALEQMAITLSRIAAPVYTNLASIGDADIAAGASTSP